MANALKQPLHGLLPQSKYEAHHAVPHRYRSAMQQGFR